MSPPGSVTGVPGVPGDPPPHRGTAVAVVPVKAFARAKGRLADHLDDPRREALARDLAEVVLAAAAPLPVTVVCDDDGVAAWARDHGAAAVRSDRDLNGAVSDALVRLEAAGVDRAVIAHADLPFAAGLAELADVDPDVVVVVPDRHDDGTNVLSVPTGRGFEVRYGPASFRAHLDEAGRRGLTVRVLRDERLAWDVDGPDDLHPPAGLGRLPGAGAAP